MNFVALFLIVNVRKKNSNVIFATKFLGKQIICKHIFHVFMTKRHKTYEKERLLLFIFSQKSEFDSILTNY